MDDQFFVDSAKSKLAAAKKHLPPALETAGDECQGKVRKARGAASREVESNIQRELMDVYGQAREERGKGCLKKQKV